MDSLRTVLNSCKNRKLSFFGKVQIIKTFGISQFTYIMSNIAIGDAELQEAQKNMYAFLWEGRDRIASYYEKNNRGLSE